jgi:hypothetical protein
LIGRPLRLVVEPRRERWSGHSHDTIGVPVPLVVALAHTENVAVMVSGVMAFPAGFSFSLLTFARMQSVGMPPALMGMRHHGPSPYDEDSVLRFGLRFADGTKVTNLDDFGGLPGQSQRRSLMPQGGGGGGRKYSQSFWCEPLPPDVEMVFVIAWPKYDIGRKRGHYRRPTDRGGEHTGSADLARGHRSSSHRRIVAIVGLASTRVLDRRDDLHGHRQHRATRR